MLEEVSDGLNYRGTSQGDAHERLRQSRSVGHDASLGAGGSGTGEPQEDEPAATRSARARGRLVCHRFGVVHAGVLHQRGEIEGALDELKTHLRGAQIILRSKTPGLVRQEFYGLRIAHFALRGLMHEAAVKGGELRQGAGLQTRLPWLSAYMGHDGILGTETYLTATPELLGLAAHRFRRRYRMTRNDRTVED